MKIAAIVPVYPPVVRIGAFLATHEFLTAAARAGHDVVVFAYSTRDRGWVLDGIPVDTGIRCRSHAYTVAAGADVVVSHAGDDGIGLDVAAAVDAKSVRMYHGAGRPHDQVADLVVYNSAASSAGAPAVLGRDRLVCRPWVDVDRHRTPSGDLVTLVNLSEAKGIRTAWRAAEDLPDVGFLGIRGGYGRQIVPRARNFVVWGTQRDMRAVWGRTRVLLMPSEHETWGMVGVEAMACGIPVIAHPTPGLVEMLGSAGTFVDRADRAGWATSIRSLVTDPDLWDARSTAALTRVAELPDDRARFVEALEQLARVEAAA